MGSLQNGLMPRPDSAILLSCFSVALDEEKKKSNTVVSKKRLILAATWFLAEEIRLQDFNPFAM